MNFSNETAPPAATIAAEISLADDCTGDFSQVGKI